LRVLKAGAQAALDTGGYATANGRQRLRALDRELIARHVSPGGSADLLAATIFLDALELQQTEVSKDRSGHRPAAQRDKKTFCSATTFLCNRRPPLCQLDRSAAERRDLCVDASSWKCFSEEYSWACGPPMRMKMFRFSNLSPRTHCPLLCHPVSPGVPWERTRGICGSADHSWKCFCQSHSEEKNGVA
jgi:hypothetical protein